MSERTDKLRRTIAELQGWRDIEIVKHPAGFYTWYGTAPDISHMNVVPNWACVLGSAHDLMVPGCTLARVDPADWPAEWECSSEHPTERGEYPVMITRYAVTPGVAICEWYVAYRGVTDG